MDRSRPKVDASVHEILLQKGGRRGAEAYANQSLAEAGRFAPIDLLTRDRGPRIIATAAATAEAMARTGAVDAVAGYIYNGWCMLGLPYRRPKGDAERLWFIETEHAAITVDGGFREAGNGTLQNVGVPFGAYARLIQLTISSDCLARGSQDIEMGTSAYDVLRRLDLPDGGKVKSSVLDQLERLARCRVTFRLGSKKTGVVMNDRIVEAFEYDTDQENRPFIRRLRLSRTYYKSLSEYNVALDKTAISKIRNSAMTIDVYCWLCYRLPYISNDVDVSWAALRLQFGHSVKEMKHFKAPFAEALELARSVYPAARFSVTRQGVTLHPSSAPVPTLGSKPRRAMIAGRGTS